MPNQVDCIIVGHGLCGVVLSHQLHLEGKRLAIFDTEFERSASAIAAGIINPISGHRLNLQTHFASLLEQALGLYSAIEQALDTHLISPLGQQRLIKNKSQASALQKRLNQIEYSRYLQSSNDPISYFRNTAHGVAEVRHCYVLAVANLLNASKSFWQQLDCFHTERFNYQQLKCDRTTVEYKGLKAKRIVFCEGIAASENPWLRDLPFLPAKGDILTIERDASSADLFLNWGKWLVADGNNKKQLRLGSNFIWRYNDAKPDPIQAEQLLTSLAHHTKVKARVINHQAAIRPTTRNRSPFVFSIPNLAHAYCFNGFGSKGCLLIPHYARLLSDHFRWAKPLPIETDPWH